MYLRLARQGQFWSRQQGSQQGLEPLVGSGIVLWQITFIHAGIVGKDAILDCLAKVSLSRKEDYASALHKLCLHLFAFLDAYPL
jgi:hypothetical protein